MKIANMGLDVRRIQDAVVSLVASQLAAVGQDPNQAPYVAEQMFGCSSNKGDSDVCLDPVTECRIRKLNFPSVYVENASVKKVFYRELSNYGTLLDLVKVLMATEAPSDVDVEASIPVTVDNKSTLIELQSGMIGIEADIQLPAEITSAFCSLQFSGLDGAFNGSALPAQSVQLALSANTSSVQFVFGHAVGSDGIYRPRACNTKTDVTSISVSGLPIGSRIVLRSGHVLGEAGRRILRSIAASLKV